MSPTGKTTIPDGARPSSIGASGGLDAAGPSELGRGTDGAGPSSRDEVVGEGIPTKPSNEEEMTLLGAGEEAFCLFERHQLNNPKVFVGGEGEDAINPDVEIHEAGANLRSSPNISHYSSLSENISSLISSKKHVEMFEKESNIHTLATKFSHYVWATGSRKGQVLSEERVEQLLRLKAFDRALIEPVYVPGNPLDDNTQIEKMLENQDFSEYGSFVSH